MRTSLDGIPTKIEEGSVHTAIMMKDYFSGRCAGYSLLPARHYGAVYGVDGGDGSEGGLRALCLDMGGRG